MPANSSGNLSIDMLKLVLGRRINSPNHIVPQRLSFQFPKHETNIIGILSTETSCMGINPHRPQEDDSKRNTLRTIAQPALSY